MWYNRLKSCALFTLLLYPNDNIRVYVGSIIRPLNVDDAWWNKIFGSFKFNTKMADAGDFPVTTSGAPTDVGIYVDNVPLEKVTDLSSYVDAV